MTAPRDGPPDPAGLSDQELADYLREQQRRAQLQSPPVPLGDVMRAQRSLVADLRETTAGLSRMMSAASEPGRRMRELSEAVAREPELLRAPEPGEIDAARDQRRDELLAEIRDELRARVVEPAPSAGLPLLPKVDERTIAYRRATVAAVVRDLAAGKTQGKVASDRKVAVRDVRRFRVLVAAGMLRLVDGELWAHDRVAHKAPGLAARLLSDDRERWLDPLDVFPGM